jgi:hypothetical protein
MRFLSLPTVADGWIHGGVGEIGILGFFFALSGFVWFPNCREAFLVVAQATLLLRSFGTVAGNLGFIL